EGESLPAEKKLFRVHVHVRDYPTELPWALTRTPVRKKGGGRREGGEQTGREVEERVKKRRRAQGSREEEVVGVPATLRLLLDHHSGPAAINLSPLRDSESLVEVRGQTAVNSAAGGPRRQTSRQTPVSMATIYSCREWLPTPSEGSLCDTAAANKSLPEDNNGAI
ncbi:hypothetical protein KUCAC02_025783, partial [Chaenocephalus aceratus]